VKAEYLLWSIQRTIRRYGWKNPEDMLKARNRHDGFDVDMSDLAVEDIILSSSDDKELLQRICDSYILSKNEQP
jgi:hypothetical protein